MADPIFLFPNGKDLAFLKSITKEVATLFFREVEVNVINREVTKVDELYGESKNTVFLPSYRIRAHVEYKPLISKLKKFGLDQTIDLLIRIDVGTLEYGNGPIDPDNPRPLYTTEDGGFPPPDVGDFIITDETKYRIIEDYDSDPFWHNETSLTKTLMCIRYRDRSVDDSELVDIDNPAGESQLPTRTEQEWFPGSDE